MTKKTQWIKNFGIILIGICFVLFVSGCTTQTNTDLNDYCDCASCCQEEKELALVDSNFYNWYINLYNEDELLFDVHTYNYGFIEAKNVKIECNVYDEYDNLIMTITEDIGNVASKSVIFNEIKGLVPNEISEMDENDTIWVSCLPISCDDCIILWERIPELRKEN